MASLMAGSSGTWPALFQRWPGRSRRKSPQPCGTAEFAENSELTAIFLPTRTLRPLFCGRNAGKVRALGENLSGGGTANFFIVSANSLEMSSEYETETAIPNARPPTDRRFDADASGHSRR